MTKGAESAGTVDRRIRHMREVRGLDVTEHARRVIYACFVLGDVPQRRDVPLWQLYSEPVLKRARSVGLDLPMPRHGLFTLLLRRKRRMGRSD
jgi:hypothetical protein